MLASYQLFAFLDVGGGEMMMIFVIVLILFGGQRMPELARGLGRSIREFKKVTSGVEEQIKQAMDEAAEKPRAAIQQALAPAALSEPAVPSISAPEPLDSTVNPVDLPIEATLPDAAPAPAAPPAATLPPPPSAPPAPPGP